MTGDVDTADTESTDALDAFARGLDTDRPEDTRSCPHADCHGSLTLTDDDVVLCRLCRCDRSGVYHPPDERADAPPTVDVYACSQTDWFHPDTHPRGRVFWAREGYPSGGANTTPERERYRVSGKVRLAGGFTEAYPQELTSRDDSLI